MEKTRRDDERNQTPDGLEKNRRVNGSKKIFVTLQKPPITCLLKKTTNRKETLVCGHTYHVYNKAVGNELLFRTSQDYNFFNSYSKTYNKINKRQGRLFIQPFKRILVVDEDYFMVLVNYIHRNSLHHELVKHFSEWKYSSYQTFLSNKTTRIERKEVLDYFDSIEDFIQYHEENKTKSGAEKLYLE